jgi:hypothetical protein
MNCCRIRNNRPKHRTAQQIQDPVEHAFLAALTQCLHDTVPGPDRSHEQTATDVEDLHPLALGRG